MIPAELQALIQWVNWRYENDGNGKPTKVPYHAASGHRADVTNPATWASFVDVNTAMTTGFYAGIGFVLTASDPYVGVDLDNPFDGSLSQPDAQKIADRHSKILTMMDSYAEWSPSGTGMHIIAKGTVPPEGRRRKKVEIYSQGRYLTFTGNVYMDKPIADRSDILTAFHTELGATTVLMPIVETPELESDYDIYEKMMRAENGDLALELWNGTSHGRTGDGSHSAGDQALVNILQFYSKNQVQITRMFYASPRAYRLVSGQKHKWPKYMATMIQKAWDRTVPDIDISQMRVHAAAVQEKLKATSATVIPKPPGPSKFTIPPGLLGRIVCYLYEQAPLPTPEVALAGALTLMAGICGRSYNVSDEGLNLYLLVLAGTGKGKEAAAKGIGKLMDKVEVVAPAAAQFRGPAEIASGPALSKFMANESPCCFSILGEFGLRLHQMCNDQAQSHQVGLRRLLLDLFHKSGKGSSLRPHIYSDKDKNTDVLHSPAYTMMGESTPATFYRYLDDSMISDGLLPRFLILEYTGPRVELSETFMNAEPSPELITQLSELATYCIQMHHSNRCSPCALTPDAQILSKSLAREFTRLINENEDNEIACQLYNRAHIKIMKIAALIAVGCNPIQPTLTVENIEWARALVERDIQNILHRFAVGKVGRETGDVNQANELGKLIKDYLTRGYDKTLERYKVPLGMKMANVIPYQYIMRQAGNKAAFRQDRMGSTFSINRAIQTLVYDGALREVKTHVLQEEFQSAMKAYAIIDPSYFA